MARLPRKRRVWWRALLMAALLLALLATVARAALPSYLQDYVNRTIDQSPDYDGRIGEIDVHLWRGAYTIHDLHIVKTHGGVPVPFFEAPRVSFTLDWRALWKGALRGKMQLQQPRINFVHGASQDQTQTGANQPWLAIIHDLYPFRIDQAEIHDGEIIFRAFHTDPEVDVGLTEVSGVISNLTNIEDSIEAMIARVEATGVVMNSGEFEFDMKFDPHSHRPTFDLAARMLNVDVTELNSLALAYGNFDFERGMFDLAIEVTTKDGFLKGYAKPLFRDLKVLALEDIGERDPLQVFWEAQEFSGRSIWHAPDDRRSIRRSAD
jgi:uncharacterized protein involved in outer membrane biogenesis